MLIFYTVRYLRPVQVIGRLRMSIPRFIRETRRTPRIRLCTKEITSIPKPVSTTDLDRFTFLNDPHHLSEVGWDEPTIPLLWRYNLHYFDFINTSNVADSESVAACSALIDRWVSENPFGKGTGWAPYPTSLRIVNWVKWSWKTGGLSDTAVSSLWNQVRWLADRPEYHLLGNHLFVNAKAMLFASAFFSGDDVLPVRAKGLGILGRELDEQFLPDGGHFELSPMYHALGMEDLIDLLVLDGYLGGQLPTARISEKIVNGMAWLAKFTYPEGELARFNDCADGIAPTLAELLEHAAHAGLEINLQQSSGITAFSDSGFVVASGERHRLIADVGPIGPDYLPGHAHSDTLSYELAVNSHRLVVNSGTGTYGVSEERLRQRGTAAHSTVTINGENSSEVWSGFRVARRAYPKDLELFIRSDGDFDLTCTHDGYARLNGSPLHRRRWWGSADELLVEDLVTGGYNEAVMRVYFHPDVKLIREGEGLTAVHRNGTSLASIKVMRIDGGLLPYTMTPSRYFAAFGKAEDNVCLEADIPEDGMVSVRFRFLTRE